MQWVDSHAHLTHADFDPDRDQVLARAREAGVAAILVAGFDLESSRGAAALSAQHPGVYAAAGIHPHDAKACDDASLEAVRALLAQPRVVAVGETGLDYHYDFSPRDVQQRVLREHLALARETNLPVILHNRESDADLLRILREDGLPPAGGVMHCFSGDERLAAEALALGLMVSAAGQVTFKKAGDLRRVLAAVPLDRLLVETDCPYLAPVPHRGRRNEPAYVVEVARCLAEARGTSPEDVAAATTANAARLFGWALP